MNENLLLILDNFALEGKALSARPLGNGLINDTFLVETSAEGQSYVLQRINNKVFTDVDMLMGNILAVTEHITKKLRERGIADIERRVLRFLPLKGDSTKHHLRYVADGKTTFWRVMVFIPDTVTKEEMTAENAAAAGRAFGDFENMLADIPVTLGETIKDFHNMEWRLEQLATAVREDRAGRVSEPRVQQLLSDLHSYADEMTKAERLYREGALQKHVCHCDTKVNNMLFSADGSEVLCVIDLDTVMPSFVFSDYGDFLRTAASTVAEDCADFSQIAFRKDIYEAFTEGYLSEAKFLTELEKEMLPFAAKLFPYMQSVRFLWDYINGDEYWKVSYPDHNFVRAMNQYVYFKAIEKALG